MNYSSAYPAANAALTGQGADALVCGRSRVLSLDLLLILAGDLRLRCL